MESFLSLPKSLSEKTRKKPSLIRFPQVMDTVSPMNFSLRAVTSAGGRISVSSANVFL